MITFIRASASAVAVGAGPDRDMPVRVRGRPVPHWVDHHDLAPGGCASATNGHRCRFVEIMLQAR
jgi:hypothetical protein